ncbi:hypothetical protein K2F54_07630 [Cryobacterium sp. 1639]|uniref:hypothetical protein n=1 Tax=Cryobacterium inferilacus TaxID=2866629 RepID=UPI001C72AD46|nr:hypothetical protein [Cryobacterium sp. 1639]MBX0299847.1 hypothetical protein [Cryobacterium sp. 1639]
MSLAAHDGAGADPAQALPRSIRFTELPRQPLDQGRGSAREIWADLDPDLSLRWQLRLIDIRDSAGLLVGPAGTNHFVVGLAGPQVAVRNFGSNRVLRRDQVLPVPSSTVQFERPKLRPPGASSLLVLTFADVAHPPGFSIHTVDPDTDATADLGAGAQLVVALRGTVRVQGGEVGPGSALLLDPAERYRPLAAAHLLTVHRPGAAGAENG